MLGSAFQVCPFAQRHFSGVMRLTYLLERHSPPRARANSCISSSVRRCFFAQYGHHVPYRTLPALASH